MPVKHPKFALKLTLSACLLALQATSALAGEVTTPAEPITSNTVNNNPVNSISDIYSDIDMRVRLANKASKAACVAAQCAENRAFDARVGAIGNYLSKAATQLYPQQAPLIQKLTFKVVDKLDAGTASNNKGQIVVLRGVQDLQLSDDALGFVLAREISHVLAGHHKTNTSTKLIISVLASVLFPAIAIVGASSAAAQASSATTLLTSAASTATSMVGGEVALAKMKPTQLSQADEMALAIMEKTEWDLRSAQSVLMQDELSKSAWLLDLEVSRLHLAKLVEAEDAQVTPLDGDLELEDIADLTLDEKADEAAIAQPVQTQESEKIEPAAEVDLVEEIVLESHTPQDVETNGVKIIPLPASIDAGFEASQ